MKRILFITAFPPNRKTAGQNYSRKLLDELSEKYFVDLICFKYKDHNVEIGKGINVLKIYKLSKIDKCLNFVKLIFIHPFFTVRFNLKLLYFVIRNSYKYDILYFDFSQVFIYSLFVKHKYKILMAHDVIYQKYLRSHAIINLLLLPLLKYSERKLFKSASKIFCFSSKDQKLILKYYQCNSIPISFYIDELIDKQSYNDVVIEDVYILYAAWNRKENNDGLNWFLNKVIHDIPYVRIKIIGPSLSDSIKQIIVKYPNIKYLGFVDNPYIELMKSKALIAPLFKGAGVKVKVLEALATGTPVIGTEVAFEGISEYFNDILIKFKTSDDLIAIIKNDNRPINISKKEEIKSLFKEKYCNDKLVNRL